MGAAFLLLETKSIIQFALLFGATWMVNSLVFGAILLSVLLANLVVATVPFRSARIPFALLAVALAFQVTVPPSALLGIEDFTTRYVVATIALLSPIFCANLVFGYLFKDTPHGDAAFGWNLVGAMIGGALEYTSLALGYHRLGWVVVLLYGLCAIWALRAYSQPGAASPPSTS